MASPALRPVSTGSAPRSAKPVRTGSARSPKREEETQAPRMASPNHQLRQIHLIHRLECQDKDQAWEDLPVEGLKMAGWRILTLGCGEGRDDQDRLPPPPQVWGKMVGTRSRVVDQEEEVNLARRNAPTASALFSVQYARMASAGRPMNQVKSLK